MYNNYYKETNNNYDIAINNFATKTQKHKESRRF
jgi:hypothetical protein